MNFLSSGQVIKPYVMSKMRDLKDIPNAQAARDYVETYTLENIEELLRVACYGLPDDIQKRFDRRRDVGVLSQDGEVLKDFKKHSRTADIILLPGWMAPITCKFS